MASVRIIMHGHGRCRRRNHVLLQGVPCILHRLFGVFQRLARVLKAGFRYGDSAPRAVIELVDRDESVKGREDRERHAAQLAAEGESAN